jgi:hypothetical protein
MAQSTNQIFSSNFEFWNLYKESPLLPILVNIPHIVICSQDLALAFLGLFLGLLWRESVKQVVLQLADPLQLGTDVALASKAINAAFTETVVQEALPQIGTHAEVGHIEPSIQSLAPPEFVDARGVGLDEADALLLEGHKFGGEAFGGHALDHLAQDSRLVWIASRRVRIVAVLRSVASCATNLADRKAPLAFFFWHF